MRVRLTLIALLVSLTCVVDAQIRLRILSGTPPVADELCNDTFAASTASRADILTAIALTSAGDCVTVPASGGVSWAGGITLNGISLIGPGKDDASPTVVTAGTVTITKHASSPTRLIGFRFTANGQHLSIAGSTSARAFIVHDNYFANNGAVWASLATNGGLFSENIMAAASAHSADVFAANLGGSGGGGGDISWGQADTIGNADTTGENNTYFEDNDWTNFLEVVIDVDNGARVVFRHDTFHDSSITVHGGGSGGSGNDTSLVGGRHLEVYDNTFDRVSNAVAINKWVWWRGSSGVFANNSVEKADSPDGSSFPNKPELRLTVGCPGSYPVQYQVGQTTQTADGTPNKPLLIFGNTGAGATDGNFITLGENPNNSCGTPSSFIQSGRDYQTSNSWSWVAYEYPHPLRAALP